MTAPSLPGVSVVIVSWNTRDLLLDALRSFLPLEGLDAEVIVVDNASTDGSADAVTEHFPELRVVENPSNLGFAGGVNVGLRAARKPFVLLLNTDTLVVDDAVRELLAYASAHPRAGVVGPRVLNEDGSLQASRFRFPSLLHLVLSATYLYQLFPRSPFFNRERYAGVSPDEAGEVDFVSGCAFLIRREALERVGLLDESFFMYSEEMDFCYRIWEGGYSVHYAPVARIVHFGGGSSRLQSRRMFVQFRRSLLRFYRKHHGRLYASVARVLLALFLLLRLPYWAARSALPGRARTAARQHCGNTVAGLRFLLLGQASDASG